MGGNQKQSATGGATAVQAAGDVSVNTGLTTSQMVEILAALSSHVETLGNSAKVEIEERLKAFEAGVLTRFATDNTTRSEAFCEPDFLAATLDAQKAYARSGDDGLREVLTDLIAQRSKIAERSRLSLTLNDAISKVGSIPEPDLNALSLIFLFQNVQNDAIGNIDGLAQFLSATAVPLLSNISTSESAANYLTAHGCLIPPSGISTQRGALGILSQRYGSRIAKGVTEEALRAKFSDYDLLAYKNLIINSPYGNDLKVFSVSGPRLEVVLPEVGVFGDYSSRYAELTEDAQPSEEEFKQVMAIHLPEIGDLLEKYCQPTIQNSRLTSIGIALAHANLAKGPLCDVDLSLWIKP